MDGICKIALIPPLAKIRPDWSGRNGKNPLPNYSQLGSRAQGTSGTTYQRGKSEVSNQAFWGQPRSKV